MIIESILQIFGKIITTLFSFINLPDMPAEVEEAINFVFVYIEEGINFILLPFSPTFLKVLLPLVIVVANFEHLYHFVLWIIKKLPISID